MKSEIQLAFENCKKEKRPALITYTVASDPNKKKSLEILKSLAKHADILELGFPHSTPIGDGGQIQTSSHRAIKNGFKMKDAFQIVKSFKKTEKNKPVILMGYYNMIFQYGENKFLNDDNFIALHGVKAKASAMKGDDFFLVDAKKSTLKGGKGSDSYWFSDWAGEKESTILDFDPGKDKIIVSKDDAFDITTGLIGANTIVNISDTASVLLKGVRLDTEEINFEITKRDFDGFDLLSML